MISKRNIFFALSNKKTYIAKRQKNPLIDV